MQQHCTVRLSLSVWMIRLFCGSQSQNWESTFHYMYLFYPCKYTWYELWKTYSIRAVNLWRDWDREGLHVVIFKGGLTLERTDTHTHSLTHSWILLPLQDSGIPDSFPVYHYNGLKQSNHNEKVTRTHNLTHIMPMHTIHTPVHISTSWSAWSLLNVIIETVFVHLPLTHFSSLLTTLLVSLWLVNCFWL